ncbi:MAG TPA: IPT/TIG domain-containing protein [Thermoanaerobaculia bacterium]
MILLLLVSLSTLAQLPDPYPNPVITSIVPSSGPAAGATEVTITGEKFGLPPNFSCVLPCPARVYFGGRLATLTVESDDRLVVLTPAHEPGVVDVTITTGDGRSVVGDDLFTFTGPSSANYETVLVPIYTDGVVNGAEGSKWATEFWLRNNGTTPVQIAPWVCPPNMACPAQVPLWHTVQPKESIHNLPAFFVVPTQNVSRLLYVTSDDPSKVSYSLRALDTSRQNLNAGTAIPVVREKDFLTTTASLLDVPWAPEFRIALRVYDAALTEARFRVRVYSLDEGVSDGEVIATYDVTASTTDQGPYRARAAYAQQNIELARSASAPLRLRIEVEPLSPGSRFWALASVTNNSTQLITVIAPQ